MTPSKILFFFCLSFTFGIFLASFFVISLTFKILVLIFSIFFISLFLKNKKVLIFGFSLLFLLLGILRYEQIFFNVQNQEIKKIINNEKEVKIIGIVSEEPERKNKTTELKVKTPKGKVLVFVQHYPEYQYGDQLEIIGKLESLDKIEVLNYKNFLLKEGITTFMKFPKIEKISENAGSPIKKFLLSIKNKMKSSINEIFSPPFSGFLEALLFGEEKNISSEWKEKLNFTGTRHIAAISGMNITIISILVFNFFLILGFWRQQAYYFSIIIIILFIITIGAPASAVRAGIMGILFLTAQYFGRLASVKRTIFLALAFMLFQNPLILRYDLGFQLSFLATFGLVYLFPPLWEIFRKIPNFFEIRSNLATTISAQLFVFPILISNFGQISPISILPNILILPILPFLTIFGFFVSLAGIFYQPIGYFLSFLALPFLFYFLKVIDIFSKIPLFFTLEVVPWFFPLIFYLILGIITYFLNKKFSQPFFLR